MKISELASRTGMSTSAIRFYESSGLLPMATRSANRYRQYDEESLQRLLVIQMAQRLGFSLESMRAVLMAPGGMPHQLIADRIAQRLGEIESMENVLRVQRAEIIALKGRLEAEWASERCLKLDPNEVLSLREPIKSSQRMKSR